MSAFEDLKDVSAASLSKLNDMLRYLYKKVQGGITKSELAPELVDDIDLVDGEKLEAGAVTADKIEDEAIASYHVQDAAITNAKIDRASVDSLVVTTADIADAAITNVKIDRASVDKLVVTTADIEDGTIGNAQIDRASVNKLVVTNADINDANINALSAGSIDTNEITVGDADGHVQITSDILTVRDTDGNERVKLGDVHDDGTTYGLEIIGTDGSTVLWDDNGITGDAIPNGTVTYNMLNNYLKDNLAYVLGQAQVFYQISEPQGGMYYDGDYWFDIDDSYAVYRYDGTAWVRQSDDTAAFKVGFLISKLIAAGAVTADKITTGILKAISLSACELDSVSGTFTTLTTGNPDRAFMVHGTDPDSEEPFIQTYDVYGNRMLGMDMDEITYPNGIKLAQFDFGDTIGVGLF